MCSISRPAPALFQLRQLLREVALLQHLTSRRDTLPDLRILGRRVDVGTGICYVQYLNIDKRGSTDARLTITGTCTGHVRDNVRNSDHKGYWFTYIDMWKLANTRTLEPAKGKTFYTSCKSYELMNGGIW